MVSYFVRFQFYKIHCKICLLKMNPILSVVFYPDLSLIDVLLVGFADEVGRASQPLQPAEWIFLKFYGSFQ